MHKNDLLHSFSLRWEAWLENNLCIFNVNRVSALTGSSAVDPPPSRWPLTLFIVPLRPFSEGAPIIMDASPVQVSCIDWIGSQPHPWLLSRVASGDLVLIVKYRSSVLLWVWVYLGKELPVCLSPLIKISTWLQRYQNTISSVSRFCQ